LHILTVRFAALVIKNAMRMNRIVICGLKNKKKTQLHKHSEVTSPFWGGRGGGALLFCLGLGNN